MKITSQPLELLKFKKLITPNVKDVKPLELSSTADENVKWCTTLENNSGSNLPYNPKISLLGSYAREIKTSVYAKFVYECS